jgi:hypothetical protein
MTDANRMINANLMAVGICMAVALGAGDQLLTWLDRGRFAGSSLLLPALLTLLIGHSLLRVVELLAFVQGYSALFVRSAVLFVLVPFGAAVALHVTKSAVTVPFVALTVDLVACGCVIYGLRRRGFEVSFEYKRWFRMGIAVAIAAAAGIAVAQLPAGDATLFLLLSTILLCYLALVAVLRVVSSADLTWAQGLIKRTGA